MTSSAELRNANLRLALVLAAIALTFGLGFMAKVVWFGL